MKISRLYINAFSNRVLPLPNGSNAGNWLCLVRGDYGMLEVQMVNNDNPQLASDGTAAATDAYSLADMLSFRFGIKLYADLATAGNWQQSFATVDATQTWHVLASGRFAMPYWLSRSLDPTKQYVCGFDCSPVLNARGHMADLAINLSVLPDLDTGLETTGPTGPYGFEYDGTVLAGQSQVVLTAPGMTATGAALASFNGAPISSIGAVCGTNTITVILGGPALVDTPVIAFAMRFS